MGEEIAQKYSLSRCHLIISIITPIAKTARFSYLKVVEALQEELFSREAKNGELEEWQQTLIQTRVSVALILKLEWDKVSDILEIHTASMLVHLLKRMRQASLLTRQQCVLKEWLNSKCECKAQSRFIDKNQATLESQGRALLLTSVECLGLSGKKEQFLAQRSAGLRSPLESIFLIIMELLECQGGLLVVVTRMKKCHLNLVFLMELRAFISKSTTRLHSKLIRTSPRISDRT